MYFVFFGMCRHKRTKAADQDTPETVHAPATLLVQPARSPSRVERGAVGSEVLPGAKRRGRARRRLGPDFNQFTDRRPSVFHTATFKETAMRRESMLPNMAAACGTMCKEDKVHLCLQLGLCVDPPVSVTDDGMCCPKLSWNVDMEENSTPEWQQMRCMMCTEKAVRMVKKVYGRLHVKDGYLAIYFGRGVVSSHMELAHRFLCFLFLGPPVLPEGINPTTGLPFALADFDCHHLCGCTMCLCPFHLAWVLKSEHSAIHLKEPPKRWSEALRAGFRRGRWPEWVANPLGRMGS